jgi:hypothetical protein
MIGIGEFSDGNREVIGHCQLETIVTNEKQPIIAVDGSMAIAGKTQLVALTCLKTMFTVKRALIWCAHRHRDNVATYGPLSYADDPCRGHHWPHRSTLPGIVA